MDDYLKPLFDAADAKLNWSSFQSDRKLQQSLSREIAGKFPCIHLYHAWSLAEMCCASPDWSPAALDRILYPTGYKFPVADILKDLFFALQNTAIPHTEGILEPDIDKRILLLDTLKRVELAQALRLKIPLYTLDGNVLS